jgi:hypothetical protein
VHAVLTAASVPALGGLTARAVQLAKEPTPFMRKAVGASAAGVLALGLLALPFVDEGGNGRVSGLAAPARSAGTPATAELPAASFDSAPAYSFSHGATESFGGRHAFIAPRSPRPASPPKAPAKTPSPPAATKPDQPSLLPPAVCGAVSLLCAGPGGNATPSLPIPAVPPVNVGVNVGGHQVGVGVTAGPTPSVGAVVDGTQIGAPVPATPTSPGATVQAGPVGPVNVPLG